MLPVNHAVAVVGGVYILPATKRAFVNKGLSNKNIIVKSSKPSLIFI